MDSQVRSWWKLCARSSSLLSRSAEDPDDPSPAQRRSWDGTTQPPCVRPVFGLGSASAMDIRVSGSAMTKANKRSGAVLDRARGLRSTGDHEGAIRLAIAVLEKDATQIGAALLLVRSLVDEDRPFLATDVAGQLVSAFIRRGDLPAAVVAAKVADAGLDEGTFLTDVADAFGEDSPRLSDSPPTPPPLPTETADDSALESLSGEELLNRAEAALQSFVALEDPIPEDAPVPTLPLFSDLEPTALDELLGAFEVIDLKPEETLIAEGTEGKEAYVVVNGVLEVARGVDEERTTLAHLGPGALFGEMALVSEAPRAASVAALEAATVLSVHRDKLERLTKVTPEIGQRLSEFCRARMVSNLMRHSAILGAVATKDRESLMGRFAPRSFNDGESLVEEGSEGEGLWLIASGSVEVVTVDEDGDELRIAELGPGDVVGEISLVLRRPTNASVRALHPTVALLLSRDEFQSAIREHPTLLGELYEMATSREEETASVVGQEAFDLGEVLL